MEGLLFGWFSVAHGFAVVAQIAAMAGILVYLLRSPSADFHRRVSAYDGWGRPPSHIELPSSE
jgi:hypothetical protein